MSSPTGSRPWVLRSPETMTTLRIGAHCIGENHPCFVIGEVAQSHDGSLGQAHAFIDAIANAGADAVKFQTHIAAAESTPAEPWRVKFSPQDATRYDYWRRMEFSEEQWRGLKKHAEDQGLVFLSSPFSGEAVELLERIGMVAWKVASGEVSNAPLLERLLATKRPLLLSSGMSPLAELDATVGERYRCPVGLSDHSGTIFAGLAAAALGCDVLEVHVTLSREMFGPDVPASVTTAELRQLVEGVRFVERMRASPVDKDAAAADVAAMRQLFTKSVVARVDLAAGTVLRPEHLSFKKPGTGIPSERVESVLGRPLRRDVARDQLLTREDLDGGA